MTKREAQIFEHHSEANASILRGVCSECEPYKEWFTYKRWLAQEKQVARGQHGVKLTTFIEDEDGYIESKDGNHFRKVTAVVFCKHQIA